ncbi:MAG: hypothetical protein ABSG32_20430 [Terriglobia bacterium]|jgi:CheY-like chemotaxis protein
MRILIVEDNEELAELTAELLRWVDQPAQYIETISLAGDLDTAIRLLPQHDAVLCDGQFPLSQDSLFIAEEWDVVQREADRCGIHFVLYSASPGALCDARDSRIPAISKPACIDEIYAALTEHCRERRLAAIADESGH